MNINVVGNENISNEEIQAYIDRANEKYGDNVVGITIEPDGEYVNLSYELKSNVPFQRLRRITGYVVGTMDRWNDAKRSEEHDRVKHA